MDELLEYVDIREASDVFRRGGNVAQFLKEKYKDTANLSDIIEIAYDLQAGTYIENVLKDKDRALAYWQELTNIIESNNSNVTSILDIGAGELTTLCGIIDLLHQGPKRVFAFDISWSRLAKGLIYMAEHYPTQRESLRAFCADIARIPLPSSSIDLVISSHGLEPNRVQQDVLLNELVRVAKRKLMLFEPCYEINSDEGKARMDLHGYIKDLDGSIDRAGGHLVEKIPVQNIRNSLNPTVCYVIEVEKTDIATYVDYTLPGTDYYLRKMDGWLISDQAGLSFPVLNDVPCLKIRNAIVSSALRDS